MPEDMVVACPEQDPADSDQTAAAPPSSQAPANGEASATLPNGAAGAPATEAAAGDQPEAADPAEDPQKRWDDVRRNLLESVRGCTALGLRAKEWDYLAAQDGWLRIDMPPAEFLAALEQEYLAEDLVKVGICQRVGDELRLANGLDGDGCLYAEFGEASSKLLLTRRENSSFPYGRTALTYALERRLPDATQSPDTLFVCPTFEDAEIPQLLELPAVSSEGLESLSRCDIERLFGDPSRDCEWRYHLVLVDFGVALLRNQPTAEIRAVIERVTDAAGLYGIDAGRRFAVWRPSAAEFQLLELAIRFEEREKVCEIFQNGAAAARALKIDCWRSNLATIVPSIGEARAALSLALRRRDNPIWHAEIRDALAVYRAALKRTVTDRLWADLDGVGNPVALLLRLQIAHLAETLLEIDSLIISAELVLAGKDVPTARELYDAVIEPRQKCMAELRLMYRIAKTKS
jgi:hypothetical protein